MAEDVQEVFTPNRLWRCRINAWKTSAFVFHEVGASVLVDKLVQGHWKKTLGSTIHLRVLLVGRDASRVFQVSDATYTNAGYRDWRIPQFGLVITFGTNGIGVALPVSGVTMPDSNEKVRAVRATGDVLVPGYQRLVLPEVCSGDFCS